MRGGGGGNGCVSFRREKFVPRGGPNGGDGGDGGDVVVESTASVRTLLDLRYHPLNFAERGVHGKGKDMHGKRGKDLVIRVPVGTICKDADTDEVLWDFQHEGERVVRGPRRAWGQGQCAFCDGDQSRPTASNPWDPW